MTTLAQPIPTEHQEQAALFELIDRYKAQYPALGMIFAIPNGGHRHKATAARLKAEGVRAGVPDIFVAVPVSLSPLRAGVVPGLFIEMKRGGGGLSAPQNTWLNNLHWQGYRTAVCYSAAEAWGVICEYLEIPLPPL